MSDSKSVIPIIKVHRCPLCKSNAIFIKIESLNGGWNEQYLDWRFYCTGCGLVKLSLPADSYYGRRCYDTVDDAVKRWNELCNLYDPE